MATKKAVPVNSAPAKKAPAKKVAKQLSPAGLAIIADIDASTKALATAKTLTRKLQFSKLTEAGIKAMKKQRSAALTAAVAAAQAAKKKASGNSGDPIVG